MNSNEQRRKKKIEKAIKACDKVTAEIHGTELTDAEFTALSEKLTKLMKVVYQQRSQRTQAASAAFAKAMETLQTIRLKT